MNFNDNLFDLLLFLLKEVELNSIFTNYTEYRAPSAKYDYKSTNNNESTIFLKIVLIEILKVMKQIVRDDYLNFYHTRLFTEMFLYLSGEKDNYEIMKFGLSCLGNIVVQNRAVCNFLVENHGFELIDHFLTVNIHLYIRNPLHMKYLQ